VTTRRVKEIQERVNAWLALTNEHYRSELIVRQLGRWLRITDKKTDRDLSPRLSWQQLDEWLTAFYEGMIFAEQHQRVVR